MLQTFQKSYKLFIFLILTGLLNFLMMPREFYRGDSASIKLSAINLIKNHDFGIDINKFPIDKGLLKNDGQYFHLNQEKNKYFNRWGFFVTLLFAVPEYFNQSSDFLGISPSSVFNHNIFNVLVSVCIFFYLFKILSKYSSSFYSKIIFVLSVMYSTYLFNYLRAQSYEIFQVFLFLVFFKSFIDFFDSKNRKFLFLSLFFLGLLVLVKDFYFCLYLPLFMYLIYFRESVGKRSIVYSLLSFFIILFLVLMANKLQFGSFMKEAKLLPEDPGFISFSPSFIPFRLFDYFLSMRFSLFIYAPALLFVFLGLRVFYRKFTRDYLFVLMCFFTSLIVLLPFFSVGEWCYGPRFFVFILPLLCLPLISFLDSFFESRKILFTEKFWGLVFVGLISYSTFLQFQFNSRSFFLKHELQLFFSDFKQDTVTEYFDNMPSHIIVNDFNSYLASKGSFYPISELARDKVEYQVIVENLLSGFCSKKCYCNYYFTFLCSK
jgi:hypothetical protein